MSSFEEEIRNCGQKRDIAGLQDVISRTSLTELLNLVESKLFHSNFTYVWSYILQGFTDTPDSHNKRYEIVSKALKELEKSNAFSSHCNAIIRPICMELTKFKSKHLIQLCEFCMECLQSQRVSQLSWKELLPEVLNVLSERECVEYNSEEMTGVECKHNLINAMCVLQWFPSNVTPLTEMFIDVSLSKEEHLQVVQKLAKYLEKLTPHEIPAFVYQLLRLCKNSNSKILFSKLQQYFGARYNENLTAQSDSENSQLDLIEDSLIQEIIEAESTVLFHIHASDSMEHHCISDYLASLKNALRAPEHVLHPFQLSVLLTVSTISQHEEKVFEIIRSCIYRTFQEEQKKAASAWFKEMVPVRSKIEAVFAQVVNASVQDRDLVLQGLVSLAFVLLGVGSALGRDPMAEKQWQLGSKILFKIIKRKRHIAATVIEQISNRIVTEHSVTQYIECLYLLSKNLTLLLLENRSLVVSLIEGLLQISGNNAKPLLDAIMPLSKASTTIRDHFILLLRKALYSRNTETRQVAVIGFLKLLSNLKISNMAVLSQNSSNGSFASGHSIYTQISMSSTSQCTPSAFSNEALCLELLTILKRCFLQQADVRAQFYAGLYDAICLNPELGIPVLDMLWLHFRDFYALDDADALPPLKFNKLTVTRDVSVTLQEPLGKLIYTIGLIVTKVAQKDGENATVVKFVKILESLVSRMIKCELVHFELDDGTDLTDVLPESQQKLIILKEVMIVYEALIGYKFYSWELESENHGKHINDLFQGYLRLLHFLKNKPKKVDKKKKDANKTTQQTEANTTMKKDAQKSAKNTKQPDTVLDLPITAKILSLLHEPMVAWTTIPQSNILKTKREFHQHVMQATLNLVAALKYQKVIEVEAAKMIYNSLCDIAMVIYERIIRRLVELIDFDCTTGVLAVECFLVILNVINNQYRSNFKAFLSRVGGIDSTVDLTTTLGQYMEVYQRLFETDDAEISDDPEIKKLSLLLVNTLHFFTNQIPDNKNALAVQTTDWLKNYAVNNAITSKQVVGAFITLLFDCHVKFKISLTFFEHVAVRIGDVTGVINEEEHNVEEFQIITESSVNSVLLALCGCIKSTLEDAEWIIARLKSEYSVCSGDKSDDFKKRERGVCCQLCFIVTILTNLSNCTVPPGTLSEAVLKNLSLMYCTLSSLTKYFMLCSSKTNVAFQAARFDRLVKLAGKQLAPVVYKFILYIEESQKENAEATQKSKKSCTDSSTLKSKVLKETRLIPKVVYEIEQLSKFVMQLSKATGVDLNKFMGQGTVRDFRILHLRDVLEQSRDGAQDENDVSVESEDEATPPPSKKRNVETVDE